jgi:hypothetical protein
MALAEGDVGESDNGKIEYSGVSSCVTVTCLLADGHAVGGHLSLMKVNKASNEVLPAMKDKVSGREIKKIHIAGDLNSWSPSYLKTPLFDGDKMAAYYAENGQPGAFDLDDDVKEELGAGCSVSSENKTGGFTIDMAEH